MNTTRTLSIVIAFSFFIPTLASAATLAELQQQLQSLLSQIETYKAQLPAGEILGVSTQCPNLLRNLSYGSIGSDVTQLQDFLISQGMLAAGNNTGFFGRMTETAVKKFQCTYMSICSGTAASNGYGAVGPATRAKIATVCAEKTTKTEVSVSTSTTTTTSLPSSPATISPSTSVPTQIQGTIDPVTWMTTTKGVGSLRVFGEMWNATKNTWESINGNVSQPFKMYLDTAASKAYWRKDMPADTQKNDGKNYEFYGEIFTFDDTSVRLRSETFPIFPCPSVGRCDPAGQAWDIRADKFRLFGAETGPLDTTKGRFLFPRSVWHGWSNGPHASNTYYCNSYSEFHSSTCTLYQEGVRDWVSVEMYQNYDIFNAEGDVVVATPGGAPQQRIYDVIILSQEQNITNTAASVPTGVARGNYRERYFFGRIGNDSYGLVRWDGARNEGGKYVLEYRTLGYSWDTSYTPQFSMMQARGAEDVHKEIPATPVVQAPTIPLVTKDSFIKDSYQCIFGRPVDAVGLAYWTQATGVSFGTFFTELFGSPEYAAKATTNDIYVKQLYECVLGRAADSGGLTYSTQLLSAGSATRANLLTNFLSSPEFKTGIGLRLQTATGFTL